MHIVADIASDSCLLVVDVRIDHTGAGQGIGRAFAHALGEAGASVAVVDINIKKAQVVTEELRSKGIRSIAVGTDVTKSADCKKYSSVAV